MATKQKSIIKEAKDFENRLHVRIQNMLFEYRANMFHKGMVPVQDVEQLMKLYGGYVAQQIFAAMDRELPEHVQQQLDKATDDYVQKEGGYFNPEKT